MDVISRETLRLAVIGCGRMGADFAADRTMLPPGWSPISHAGAAQRVDGIELVALCDPDPQRLAAAANRYRGTATYTDPQRLLAAEGPDLVTVATRTPERHDIICAAVEANVRGLHLEKPIARSLVECRAVLDVLLTANAKFSYGTTRRFMDAYRQARDMVASGAIGNCRHIAIEHGHDLLLWGHPHSTDLMVYFADCHTADRVQADLDIDWATVAGTTIDDDPRVNGATVQFANGVTATILKTAGLTTRITGSEGVLAVVADGTKITLQRRASDDDIYFHNLETIVPLPAMSGTMRALSALAEAVRGDDASPVSAVDIEAGTRLLLAFAQSALANGANVDPATIDEHLCVTGRFGALTA